MLKKLLKVFVAVVTLFYCTNVGAYEYIDSSHQDDVESMIDEVKGTVEIYEWLADSEEVEEEDTFLTVSSNQWWWPIGSDETTTSGDKIFATGNPNYVSISSPFGYRVDPSTKEEKFHGGIDIPSNEQVNIVNVIAPQSGVVEAVQDGYDDSNICSASQKNFANYIKIRHSDGTLSMYWHLAKNSITVKKGDSVLQGEVIAKIGQSGYSCGAHLHFEVHDASGNAVDPLTYVDPQKPRPVSTTISGNSNKQTICLTLKNMGFDDTGVAALMANMNAESGLNPINLENSYERKLGYTDETYTAAVDSGSYTNFIRDSAGYGLIQFTFYTLKEGVYNSAKAANKSVGDAGVQLGYLQNELKSNYPVVYDYLKSTSHTYSDKAQYFCTDFERPAAKSTTCPKRATDSSQYYQYSKNNCQE